MSKQNPYANIAAGIFGPRTQKTADTYTINRTKPYINEVGSPGSITVEPHPDNPVLSTERIGFFDVSCLHSIVKNTSGITMRFGFLPPHGAQLKANESYTVFGNITEAIQRSEYATGRRQMQALLAAIDRGDITIVSTPSPLLYNSDTNGTKMLKISGGSNTVSAVDPCWKTSDSLDAKLVY